MTVKKKTKDEAQIRAEAQTIPLEARVIQYITNFPAPTTTQDAVDRMSAELATAGLMRTQAEKRYDAIKRMIFDEFSTFINQVRDQACQHMQKSTHNVVGEEWEINISANKPAMRVDTDELRTELVKMGVSVTVIDMCINKVSKKATPATIITAKPVV